MKRIFKYPCELLDISIRSNLEGCALDMKLVGDKDAQLTTLLLVMSSCDLHFFIPKL